MAYGVYQNIQSNGSVTYRSSITYHGKHISLGSYSSENEASQASFDGNYILRQPDITIQNFMGKEFALSFAKVITLINYRDHGIYIKTPIYLRKNYFEYYLSETQILKFDMDDLFYYSTHTIMKRKGHLFVSDYGMQVTIGSRYGIRPFAVLGRDFRFLNEDSLDFRYSNVEIINPYHGVTAIYKKRERYYRVKIHINGNYTVGIYRSEKRAAIAYNKAADLAKQYGIKKNFPTNFLEDYSAFEYAELYSTVKISNHYLTYLKKHKLSISDLE